jgi:hypothetical protein
VPKVNARYVDTPSIGSPMVEVPLKKHSEDAVCEEIIPLLAPLSWCTPDYR